MKVTTYLTGQRYRSETEPNLGLGIVVDQVGKTLCMYFPNVDLTRNYSVKNAPLKRVLFSAGDLVCSIDGQEFIVDSVIEVDGLMLYLAAEGVFTLSERDLLSDQNFQGPLERFLSGSLDKESLYHLRHRTLELRSRLYASNIRGYMGARISLIPHQMYVASEIASRPLPRVLLADEVGLGKTIEAGLILHNLILTGRINRALIIVPNSLVYQWFVELYRRFQLSFTVIHQDTILEKDSNPFDDAQFIIAAAELLGRSQRAQQMVQDCQWGLVVADEAHRLAWTPERPSPLYTLVETLAAKAQGVLLLTATPEQLGHQGHFARLRLLDPHRYYDYQVFEEELESFAQVAQLGSKLIDHQELTQREKNFLSRFVDEEDGDASSLSNEELLKGLLDRHGTGRVLFRNTRQVMDKKYLFFPKRILHPAPLEGTLKEVWLKGLLEDHPEQKFLLICQSKELVLELEEFLRNNTTNLNFGVFHSDLSLMARDRQAAYFADPAGARILLCSEIGSEGRNFQFCQHIILYDLPTHPDLLEQRIGRLDRIGQTKDINIHVPYQKECQQEALFLWYHQGMDAFQKTPPGAPFVYQSMQKQLQEVLERDTDVFRPDDQLLMPLITQTQEKFAQVQAEIENGRDRLLELNSFHPEKAQQLISEIKQWEQSGELQSFLEEVFDHLGVEMENLDRSSFFIRPGDNMFVPAFPGLSSEGMSITFERQQALEREDLQLISWDHPMVMGVFELLLGHEFGNVTLAMRKNTRQIVKDKIFLEGLFVLEADGPQEYNIPSLAPPTVIRTLINIHDEDLSQKWPKEVLDKKLMPVNSNLLHSLGQLPKQFIKDLVKSATLQATQRGEAVQQKWMAHYCQKMDAEIQRLQYLQTINNIIRDEEIEYLAEKRETVLDIMDKAKVTLDSFRLIF